MKFFVDSANVANIKELNSMGLVDGVTTNPSIIAKEGKPFKEVVQEICRIVKGPVSAEVTALDCEGMLEEARDIATWADNIVVKIPMTDEGLKAVSILSKESIKTNVTLIFSVAQGLLAAKVGATYISPFVGRLDDVGAPGVDLIRRLKTVLTNYEFEAEIICASIRTNQHLELCAEAGGHIATIPDSLFGGLSKHPLTDVGIKNFMMDWENYKALV